MNTRTKITGVMRGWIAVNPDPEKDLSDSLVVHTTERQRDGAVRNGWLTEGVVVLPAAEYDAMIAARGETDARASTGE